MAFEKQSALSSIEILPDGRIKVRYAQVILEDGEVVARNNKQVFIEVGDDTSQLPPRVQAIAAAVWDADTIAKRRAKKKAQLLGQED